MVKKFQHSYVVLSSKLTKRADGEHYHVIRCCDIPESKDSTYELEAKNLNIASPAEPGDILMWNMNESMAFLDKSKFTGVVALGKQQPVAFTDCIRRYRKL